MRKPTWLRSINRKRKNTDPRWKRRQARRLKKEAVTWSS